MSEPAIQIEALGKRYRRGASTGLSRWLGRGDTFWALRDLDLQVAPGEAVGIIGRNGAGKSTLLKVLSQITPPTTGRAVISGRVASLLEVGTGFHPELTGRENIYLNGSILGMGRREIKSKLDQIIDFSGVEAFLDTPVKRYSSGMRVRLAFAVAAHLEPEVLIVDEVLAVGDAAFQSKCVGKMRDVAGHGRTVLFVSHNMSAVTALCGRAVWLEHGKVRSAGDAGGVADAYQAQHQSALGIPLSERDDRRGNGVVRFTGVEVRADEQSLRQAGPVSGRAACFSATLQNTKTNGSPRTHLVMVVRDAQRCPVFTCSTKFQGQWFELTPGGQSVVCRVPALPLAAGTYWLDLWCEADGLAADHIEDAATFTVSEGAFFNGTFTPVPRKHGCVLVDQQWSAADAGSLFAELAGRAA